MHAADQSPTSPSNAHGVACGDLVRDWIQLGYGFVPLANGTYEIEGSDDHFDPELPPGQIELYDHPVRGQSYWDEGNDDGSDYAGHTSPFYLGRCRVRRIPNRYCDKEELP
jgi:hypothetical protein